jgi:hypothetical protein
MTDQEGAGVAPLLEHSRRGPKTSGESRGITILPVDIEPPGVVGVNQDLDIQLVAARTEEDPHVELTD